MRISINNLRKSFGKKLVLKDFSVDFEEGRIYSILGKNGAGKSTLLNIICNIIPYDSGEIRYNSYKYTSLPTFIKQNIGFMSDQSSLIHELTPLQYLTLIANLYHVKEPKRRIRKLLDYFFENESIENTKINTFSTGMRKKIEFCAVLIHKPDMLILDEPFSGLDPVGAEKIIKYLSGYCTQIEGRTIIVTSHQLDHIERINPELILLNNNEIQYQGSIVNFRNTFQADLHDGLVAIYSR
ncbi:ABC transporter ATP-binding protein [Membranicola marinus]|uniref:ABC transporter ATP-binding protein n=1 Tax=Membranihabitans marinus TaxID=1227546 RepID=A0A953HKW7_9BACT|nr:ABC transporter ATP-binding protein [Membranihabitans marinus]MBY5957789.1 ABC transporter ATP-binding protein [Membranihabitans marinus]